MSGTELPLYTRCTVWTLPKGAQPRIKILEAPDEPADPRVDALWDAKVTANPRLFNGPVLNWIDADPERATVRTRRDEFKRLTVQPEIDCAVTHLGVTCILIAPDHTGEPHVFLGKRGAQTRIFGGLWELGPSGGVDAPPRSQDHLDHIDLWKALRLEIAEELGLPIDPDRQSRSIDPVAFFHDPIGMSFEVAYRVELTTRVEDLLAMAETDANQRTSSWEYEATRWLPIAHIPAFDDAENEAIIPPTRALFRALGWIPSPTN